MTTEASLKLSISTGFPVQSPNVPAKTLYVYAVNGETPQPFNARIQYLEDGNKWITVPKGYAIKRVILKDENGNPLIELIFPESRLATAINLGSNTSNIASADVTVVPAKASSYVGSDYDPSVKGNTINYSNLSVFDALIGATVVKYDSKSNEITTSDCEDIDTTTGIVTYGDCLQTHKEFIADSDEGIDLIGTIYVAKNDGSTDAVTLDVNTTFKDYIRNNFKTLDKDTWLGNLYVYGADGSLVILKRAKYEVGDDGYPEKVPVDKPTYTSLGAVKVSNDCKPSIAYDDDSKSIAIQPSWFALVRDENGNPPMVHTKWCFTANDCIDESMKDSNGNPLVVPYPVKDMLFYTNLTSFYSFTAKKPGYMYSATADLRIGNNSIAKTAIAVTLTPDDVSQSDIITQTDTELSSEYLRFQVNTSGTLVDKQVSIVETTTDITIGKYLQYDSKYSTLIKLLDKADQKAYLLLPNKGVPTAEQNPRVTKSYTYADVNGQPDYTAYIVEPVPRSDNNVYATEIGDNTKAFAFIAGRGLVYARNAVVKVADGVYTHPNVEKVEYKDLGITILGYDADPVQDAQTLTVDENGKLTLTATQGGTITTTAVKPDMKLLLSSVETDSNGNKYVPVMFQIDALAFATATATFTRTNLEDGTKSDQITVNATVGDDWTPSVEVIGGLNAITNYIVGYTSAKHIKRLAEVLQLDGYYTVGNEKYTPPLTILLGDLSSYYKQEAPNKYTAVVQIEATYEKDQVKVTAKLPIVNGKVIYSTDTNKTKADQFTLEYSKAYYPCEIGGGEKFSKLTVTLPYWATFTKEFEIPDPAIEVSPQSLTVKTYGWACKLNISVNAQSMPLWPELDTKPIKQLLTYSVGKVYSVKWLDVLDLLPLGEVTVTLMETKKQHKFTAEVKQATDWPDAVFEYNLGLQSNKYGCKEGGNVVDCCKCTYKAKGYVLFTHNQITYAYYIGMPAVELDFSSMIETGTVPRLVYNIQGLWHSPVKLLVKMYYLDKTEIVTKGIENRATGEMNLPKDVYKVDVVVLNKCNFPIYQTTFYNKGFIYGDLKYNYTVRTVTVTALVVDDNAFVELLGNTGDGYIVMDRNEGIVAKLSGDYPVPPEVAEVLLVAGGANIGVKTIKKLVVNPTKLQIEKLKKYAIPLFVMGLAIAGGFVLGTSLITAIKKVKKK